MEPNEAPAHRPEASRHAESALKRLGYARVTPSQGEASVDAAFWVEESGIKHRLPVFIEGQTARFNEAVKGWMARTPSPEADAVRHRAILVVPTDGEAEAAWHRYAGPSGTTGAPTLSILVLPADRPGSSAHWHARVVARAEILRLATGVVVGLFRRAQSAGGSNAIDFEEMLGIIRDRFGVDVHRSLGVRTDEDALYLIYQMATKEAYAPGDPASNLHALVLKPSGPGARLPWFAA